MNIEKILEYQALDQKIVKLQESVNKSHDQEQIERFKKIKDESVNKTDALETEATKLLKDYAAVQKKLDAALSAIENMDKNQTANLSPDQCAECVTKLNRIRAQLAGLENELGKIASAIKNVLDQNREAFAKYKTANEKISLHKTNLDSLQTKVAPEIESLTQKLSALESGLKPEFLKKYKTKRQDMTPPVVVPLRGNVCGRCGMELPSAQIEKLKKNGFLECENERCHRIIYYTE